MIQCEFVNGSREKDVFTENLNRVDGERLVVDAIHLDNGHGVSVDANGN